MEERLTITLEQVRLYGHHGVFSQETLVGAEFDVWIELELPLVEGCRTDNLDGTISYADVYEVMTREFDIPSKLLEHLVFRMSRAIIERWPQIDRLTAKVRKVSPPIPNFQGSAVVTYSYAKP